MTKPTTSSNTKPVVRTSAGLRDALFDELDNLRNGATNATVANATARLATGIVDVVQMELEVQRFAERVITKSERLSDDAMPRAIQLGC